MALQKACGDAKAPDRTVQRLTLCSRAPAQTAITLLSPSTRAPGWGAKKSLPIASHQQLQNGASSQSFPAPNSSPRGVTRFVRRAPPRACIATKRFVPQAATRAGGEPAPQQAAAGQSIKARGLGPSSRQVTFCLSRHFAQFDGRDAHAGGFLTLWIKFVQSPTDPLHKSLCQFLTFLFTVLEAFVLIFSELDLFKGLEVLQFSREPSLIQLCIIVLVASI